MERGANASYFYLILRKIDAETVNLVLLIKLGDGPVSRSILDTARPEVAGHPRPWKHVMNANILLAFSYFPHLDPLHRAQRTARNLKS